LVTIVQILSFEETRPTCYWRLYDIPQVTTTSWVKNFGGQKIIQVDTDPTEIGKNYPVELGIVGDAIAVLKDLLVEVKALLSKLPAETVKESEERKKARQEANTARRAYTEARI